MGHATGVGIMRGLYHGWPMEEAAYRYGDEYLFGAALIVAPATQPVNPLTKAAAVPIWLPPGPGWVLFNTSTSPVAGNQSLTVQAAIEDVPLYTFVGSAVATFPFSRAARFASAVAQYDQLEFVLHWPTLALQGGTWVYEDDGMSNDYLNGQYIQS